MIAFSFPLHHFEVELNIKALKIVCLYSAGLLGQFIVSEGMIVKTQLKLFLALILISMSTKAEDISTSYGKTPQEEAMCQTMIYNGRDTSDRNNWQHMHHFCDCMRFINRAYSAFGDKSLMGYDLGQAIGNCDYVLKATTPDFYMRPEVHLQKGIALRLKKEEGKAVLEFMEAVRGNPKLAKAYVELANTQKRLKTPTEALKTVSEGLRYNPKSKALQRIYTELGGKLPYPEAFQAVPTVVAEPKVSNENESVIYKPAIDSEDTSKESPPSESNDKSKIGSPSNPYCRFCTEDVK